MAGGRAQAKQIDGPTNFGRRHWEFKTLSAGRPLQPHQDQQYGPRIPDITPEFPDVLHCHNLHGSYFDLRALPRLSHKLPVLLTLHDTWLLSGHCAYSFDCERWKTGCGRCPDLTIYPAIKRDATAYNWQRKREIYAKSQLYIATPSRWLMAKFEQSMLAPAVLEARIIPNGVDLSVFHPADKQTSREILAIPQEAKVLLFTANGIQRNPFKDYETVQDAVGLVAERLQGQRVLFLALGEAAPVRRIGEAEVRFVAYESDPKARSPLLPGSGCLRPRGEGRNMGLNRY